MTVGCVHHSLWRERGPVNSKDEKENGEREEWG